MEHFIDFREPLCYRACGVILAGATGVGRRSSFEMYARTGRRPADAPDRVETKFNQWHDPKDGRFTFAGQGNYASRGNASPADGPLTGATPVEKQRTAQINRLLATITLHLEKRGSGVSGSFTQKGRPGSLKFTGTITSVKGQREIRIVGMKWSAPFASVESKPDMIRIFNRSGGLFAQMNKRLLVTLQIIGKTIVDEQPIPQRLNRPVQ